MSVLLCDVAAREGITHSLGTCSLLVKTWGQKGGFNTQTIQDFLRPGFLFRWGYSFFKKKTQSAELSASGQLRGPVTVPKAVSWMLALHVLFLCFRITSKYPSPSSPLSQRTVLTVRLPETLGLRREVHIFNIKFGTFDTRPRNYHRNRDKEQAHHKVFLCSFPISPTPAPTPGSRKLLVCVLSL